MGGDNATHFYLSAIMPSSFIYCSIVVVLYPLRHIAMILFIFAFPIAFRSGIYIYQDRHPSMLDMPLFPV